MPWGFGGTPGASLSIEPERSVANSPLRNSFNHLFRPAKVAKVSDLPAAQFRVSCSRKALGQAEDMVFIVGILGLPS